MALLEVDNIRAGYGDGPDILKGLSVDIESGKTYCIIGPNGAGKTTLFKALLGLLPLKAGHIRIHGQPLGHHQDCVAYVPQREEVDWRFPVTVYDVVMMGRIGQQGLLRRPSKADREAVAQSLENLGISDLGKRPIGELSGGQQQRVFLARALAQEPHILLMDEPFTGVDFTTQEATLDLLEHLQVQKVTAMVSTHDLTLASERFEQVLLLNKHLIAYGSPAEVFTPPNLSQAFGSQVLFLDGVAVVDQCCPPDEGDV